MLDSGLYRLYQLHQVDATLHELKAHASALDVGQGESAKLKLLIQEAEPIRSVSRALKQEQTDLDLLQRQLIEKKKGLEKKLYDGSVVSSREITAMEKEVILISEQIDKGDERLLELMELIPPAIEATKKEEVAMVKLKKTIEQKKEAAVVEHERLKKAYAEEAKKRAPAAARVPKHLLEAYEALKAKIGAPAMAVVTEISRCGACGILVPERSREMIRQDRMVQCESCRRYLFSVVPDL